MDTPPQIAADIHYYYFALLVIPLAVFWRAARRQPKSLPIGPPGQFLVGNAFQLPQKYLHLKLTEWAREYGGIFLVRVLSQNIVILSSAEAIKEVLDKQGLHTGGRTFSPLARIVVPSFIIPNEIDETPWKYGRRVMRDFLSGSALNKLLPIQDLESTMLLKDMLNAPQNVRQHITRAVVSSMMTIVYGKRCAEYKNTNAQRFIDLFYAANVYANPNEYPLVNAFPILNTLPEFMAPWKRDAQRYKTLREDFNRSLLRHAVSGMEKHQETGCMMEFVLKEGQLTEWEMINFGMAVLEAGTSTSASTAQLVIIAALNYPGCQKKVHEELDRVVGVNRLPVLSDFDNLPYLRAFIDEAERLRPSVPLGVPHTATKDVLYKGYMISKGSMILMNPWGLLKDPDMFDSPESFIPERYLKTRYGTKVGVNDQFFRNNFVFGAGRRICPGEAFARRSIAIISMRLFWAFEFKKDGSGTGNIDPTAFFPSIESGPLPFTCIAEPRGDNRISVIKTLCEKYSA